MERDELPGHDDLEDLLWELGRLPKAEEAPRTPDLTLEAYRNGRLSEAEASAVESELIRSPATRARLLELSGVAPAPAPETIRARILTGRRQRSHRAAARRVARRWWPAAAALAATVLLVVLVPFGGTPRRPGGPGYEVTVRGLSEVRSGEPGAAAVVPVRPDTPIEILARARGAAVAGIDLALYRRLGGSLERLEPGPSLTVKPFRGGARFVARAADLLGGAPGRHRLYLVAAAELPERLAVDGGGRAWVHPLTFDLMPEPEPGSNPQP